MNTRVDVLVVGAGSAGCILAERLSADPGRRVLVVEAGPDRRSPAIAALTDPATELPIGPHSPVVRHYRSALTAEHSAQIVRGWCVGGSGAVNGGYFCRALPADFDAAITGWSWADVEPHYRAVEERIGIRFQDEFASSTGTFIGAAVKAGFSWLPDINNPPGVGPVPLNVAGGIRRGPGAVFLETALARPNLKLLTDIRVTRLVVTGARVTGVEAFGDGGPVRIDAGEVVLSAGAIASAQLLMLSGIGPADALSALGIGVVADLPVGQASQDHPEWLLATDWPAQQGHPVLEAVLVTDDCEIRPYTTGFGAPRTSVGIALMRPRSRGRLSLVSCDPAVNPRIEHRYDSQPADLGALERGAELLAQITSAQTRLGEPVWSTSQHLCSTAPMGPDEAGVVDAECRVRGLEGLRVVDGSVLPKVPSRGPHATIAMLAHRAAEFF